MNEHRILIVDDQPGNLQLLKSILRKDYKLTFATNGIEALEAVEKSAPDLILLDVMMPEMDGYEVCRRLKNDENTKNIPIIFVTARQQEEDEIKGLEMGAADYITKPISPARVRARIKIHLALREARLKLQEQNEQLHEAARLKEDVNTILRHDLKSFLTGVIGIPQSLLLDENLTPDQIDDIQTIETLGFRMLNMINFTLDLFKIERGIYKLKPVSLDLLKIVKNFVKENKDLARSRNVQVRILVNNRRPDLDETFIAWGEELLCYSMIYNLVKNAIEASLPGRTVTISLSSNKNAVIEIHNESVVSEEIRDKFFEKYVTSGKQKGTGLGTYSAKLIAETQGGEISMRTSETEGTTVKVCLPISS